MFLWLDDIRPAPNASWTVVKTAKDAIALLETGNVTRASLDFDIHWDPTLTEIPDDWQTTQTGLAVVLWMEEHKSFPSDGVCVHSANPEGAKAMKEVLWRNDQPNVEQWG